MNAPPKVEITNVAWRRDPPGSVVEYRVLNRGDRPIWMVDDGWITWRQKGSAIELSLARGRMSPGSAVFGYFPPEVREIRPGETYSAKLSLDWPLHLDRLWNEQEEAAPDPGRYDLSLRIGYGETPERGPLLDGDGVEDPILRWQKESVSDPYPLEIGEYRPSRKGESQ